MYRAPMAWPSTCFNGKNSPMTIASPVCNSDYSGEISEFMSMPREINGCSNASMRQWESPWQQKNAAIPAGMEPQWQQKNAAFLVEQKPETWEEKWEKEISQWGRRASSGVHETHEEFSGKFRQTLQEFAMFLTKKFHYEFPVEYFDDYQGNLNKEEFLGMEQSKEELRWWKVDSLPISNMEKNSAAIIEEQQQLKVEGLDNVEGFLSNDKKETAPAEGRLADPKQCHHIAANFGDDIGDGLHPSKGTCNEQIDRAANAEGSFDIAEKEVQIEGNCSQQKGKDVADWKENNVESLAGKNKSHSIMFVVTTAGRLEFLSPLLKGGMKTGIDEAAQQVVSGAMQGIDGIMFAYGATSSGKTHTMHGEQKSTAILPLAVKDSLKISPAKLWKKRKKEAYWKLQKFGMSWGQDMFQGGEIVMSLE